MGTALDRAEKAEVAVASPSGLVPAPASPMAAAAAAAAITQLDYLPNKYIGRVVSVTDGDTIDVALAPQGLVQAVRLEGIDAPEHDQAFGAQSTQHLSELVSGKTVTLGCENEEVLRPLHLQDSLAKWRGRMPRTGESGRGVALQAVSG